MTLNLQPTQTGAGPPKLVLNGRCKWDEFPDRVQPLINHLAMTITQNIDTPDIRFWYVRRDGCEFGISWDIWRHEVTIRSCAGTSHEALLALVNPSLA